ncbi:MAG: polyphosphate polymerase domain-containing protein [Clostridia bacterium]|nr:polyphosphate polymerase domain-containing protein [Clostridia bacterium]
MVSEAKYRHEFKYFINACDRELLSRRLGTVMKKDPHTTADGTYVIRSLYFDNFTDTAYFEKVNGGNPRAKFRIRIYNGDDSFISLEKKVKCNDLTQKLQARITREECEKIIAGDIDWMLNDGRGVVAELYAKMRGIMLRPKTLVEYTRTPFIYEPAEVRVTLDCDIRTGIFSNNLFDPFPCVPTDSFDVLEVKYNEFLPNVVRYLINPICRSRQSSSKYEICRQFG